MKYPFPTAILKHFRSSVTNANSTHQRPRVVLTRVSTLVAVLVVVGGLAAGFMVVSGRAAGLGFDWSASFTKILVSRSARSLSPPPPVQTTGARQTTTKSIPAIVSTSIGDVAVDVGNTAIKKLNAADGTVLWSASVTNDGALAVDQLDLGVYTGNGNHNFSSPGTVYKYNAVGGLAWTNTVTGAGCNFYYVNGAAVDTTSSSPGVVFTEGSCFGGIAKTSRSTGAQQWSLASNDIGRPSIDPANGQIYDTTYGSHGYNTIYSATTAGSLASASSCEGNTDLNPADGMLYRGGNSAAGGCGLVLYQMNKSNLATPNWSMTVPGIASFDTLAVQPWSGGYIYVASSSSTKIVVVNPATQTVVTSFTPAVSPNVIAVNPNGGNLYVANTASNFVYAYTPTGTLVWTSPDLGGPVYNLAAPRGIVGTPPAPGEIEFTDTSYTVGEGGGTAAITVTRTGGSAGSITANFNASDGTATDANNDYEPVSNFPVSYADGETGTKTINVTINPDSVYEGNETVNLSLSGTVVLRPQGGSLPSATLTITNDDNPPTTLVVNTTADPGTGICDAAECTLREAITAANANLGDANAITFNIPAADPGFAGGVFTIMPTSALPTIRNLTNLDGTTQTAFTGDTNTFGPEVVLNGSLAGVGVPGFYISGDNNTIKGLVINGFSGGGVGISYPNDSTPSNNQILNNYIGTNASGTAAVPNGGGVDIHGFGSPSVQAANNTVQGNIISGNTGAAIGMCDAGGTAITSNLIGTKANGSDALGNGGYGINLQCAGVVNSTIQSNTIAFNGSDGFRSEPDYRFGNLQHENKLTQNSIFENGGLGINLLPPPFGTVDGVTPNDPQDTDTGANNLQNFPVIASAKVTGSTRTITGALNTNPSSASGYTIEFFANTTCDGTNGEGKTYLGAITSSNTNASGDVAPFTFHPAALTAGDVITATATDSSGNTSEFSACFTTTTGTAGAIVFTTSTFTVGEGGGMAAITVERVGGSDGAITANFSTSNGSATEPDDYTAVTNFPINYADGETGTKTVNVTIIDDSTYEGDETVDLLLDGTVVLRPQGVPQLTIVDNDAAPTFSISATSGHLEGDMGTSSFDFTVTKTGSTALTATVRVDTVDESAQSPGDYAAIVNQVLTFNPTDTTQTVNVTVNGDTDYEGSDVFFVDLSSPVNATIAAGQGRGVGTIINDDNPPPTLVVTKTADTDNHFCDPANCSLREAIEAANFAADTNTITFSIPGGDPGCTGGVCTITETLGEMAISQSVNINGTGANSLIVSGNNTNRVFNVTAIGTYSFSGLTIANGFFPSGVNGGGGISSISGGNVNISNSTLSGNSTPGSGGGIFCSGTVNVSNSTFSGNQSGNSGGGIFAYSGVVNIINSTFSGNSTPGNNGGGIFVYFSAAANITNSTFAGNSAEFGGGIYNTNTGVVNLRNTIVALNTTTAGSPDINNTVTSQGHNLLGKSNGSSGLTDGVNGDKVGTVAMPLDPQIGPLQNNGGPTFTRALLIGSPALDAGDNCVFDNTCLPTLGVSLTTDQRGAGFARKLDGDFNGTPAVDMGAFELNAAQTGPAFLVNSTNDPGDGTCNSAECTLREAINAANANVDANTINFGIPLTDPGFAGGVFTIMPTSGLPYITSPVTIDGASQTSFTGDTNVNGPEIVLNGSLAGATSGLLITADNCTIKDLVSNGFTDAGLAITYIVDTSPTGNQLLNNYVGTDPSGTAAVPNGSGISVGSNSASSNTVSGNLVSGNSGIGIGTCDASNTTFSNNKVGTDRTGTLNLGNGAAGMHFFCSTGSNNTITGNTIAFNGTDGFRDEPDYRFGPTPHFNNRLTQNSFFENVGLGINLLPAPFGFVDGATANDPMDPDTGGNNLQNFPTLMSASVTGSTKTVTGLLNTTPATTGYVIEFFNNAACDGSGNGEGKTYLGSVTTGITDGSGNVLFTFHPATLSPGDIVTATATDSLGNTSEFSQCKPVGAGTPGNIAFTSSTFTVGEGGGTAAITVERVGGSDGAVTANFSTGDGSATEPGDYTAVTSFPISYADGETGTKTVFVTINQDAVYEGDETVDLFLDGTVVLRPQGVTQLIITDDDAAPVFTIDDVTHNEGNSLTTSYVFTVTKTGSTDVNASVQFQTVDGSATLADNDYQTHSGTLNFTPAQMTQQITVLVNGDTTNEPDEAFTVHLFNPVAATITDADGTGTITNDDFVASISGRVLYRDLATAAKNVTMTLTAPSFTTQTTTTDTNGDYSFTGVPTGNDYTLTPSKTGDINGIESFDAARVARFVSGLEFPTPGEAIAADADGDGIRTSLDAALIARRVAGLPGFGIVGTWKFVPVNRTYLELSADQTGQNFTAILVGDTSGNWIPAIPSGGGDDGEVSGSAPQSSNSNLPKLGDLSFGLVHPFTKDRSGWKACCVQSSDSWPLPLTLLANSNNFSAFMVNRRWY
jgi:CSLREA domain-containing protein